MGFGVWVLGVGVGGLEFGSWGWRFGVLGVGVGGFGFWELGLSEMLLCLGPLSCPIQESLLRQVCAHEGWRFRVWVSLNPKP